MATLSDVIDLKEALHRKLLNLNLNVIMVKSPENVAKKKAIDKAHSQCINLMSPFKKISDDDFAAEYNRLKTIFTNT